MQRLAIVAAAAAFAAAACQTRPAKEGGEPTATPDGTRVTAAAGDVARVEGKAFDAYVLLPSDGANPPEWKVDSASIDAFEAALVQALATAENNPRIEARPGWAEGLDGYVRRYLGYFDREGGKRMIVDFYCDKARANASRTRSAPLDLPPERGCFARAIFDASKNTVQQLAVR